MEPAALVVLKSLGELKRAYLTELEEKLLGVLAMVWQIAVLEGSAIYIKVSAGVRSSFSV
ncbi:hypothetical protein [Calothrix sp. CCY 0018]|uniref:hypothetical protein n=1 Tax=Calothrix sp. CCY 0018 TaxID=3103864 RepID=UPI0039C74ABC